MNDFLNQVVKNTSVTWDDLEYVPETVLNTITYDFNHSKDFWNKYFIMMSIQLHINIYKHYSNIPEEEKYKISDELQLLNSLESYGLDKLTLRGYYRHEELIDKYEHFFPMIFTKTFNINLKAEPTTDIHCPIQVGHLFVDLYDRDMIIDTINLIHWGGRSESELYKYTTWDDYLNHIYQIMPTIFTFYVTNNIYAEIGDIDAAIAAKCHIVTSGLNDFLEAYVLPSTIDKLGPRVQKSFAKYPNYISKLDDRKEGKDFPFLWFKYIKEELVTVGFYDCYLYSTNIDADTINLSTDSFSQLQSHKRELDTIRKNNLAYLDDPKLAIYGRLAIATCMLGQVLGSNHYACSILQLGFILPYKDIKYYRPVLRSTTEDWFDVNININDPCAVPAHSFIIVDDLVFDAQLNYFGVSIQDYFKVAFPPEVLKHLYVDELLTIGNYVPKEFPIKTTRCKYYVITHQLGERIGSTRLVSQVYTKGPEDLKLKETKTTRYTTVKPTIKGDQLQRLMEKLTPPELLSKGGVQNE